MSKEEPAYYICNNNEQKQQVFELVANQVGELCVVQKNNYASASWNDDYRNIDTNISVRSPYVREDYEKFRPDERIPTESKEMIRLCMHIYKKESLVKNVIDLMADFACQGIEIYHPNPTIQKFCRNWWHKIDGVDRSERFLNMLYRTGNVVIRRVTAKIGAVDRRKLQNVAGAADIEYISLPKAQKYEIPVDYIIFNPLVLDIVGDRIAAMTGKYIYQISIPKQIQNLLKKPNPELESMLLEGLPEDVKESIKTGKPIILDPSKTFSYFYKKDDWEAWADPMIYPLVNDLMLLSKMRLADLSALDGVISNVRLWKLGQASEKTEAIIMPSAASIAKLINALAQISAGGTADLVWDPFITLEQHIPDVDKILGSEKYESVMQRLHQGLGVPPSLNGSSNRNGFTNNYISLKTLIERLNYGRNILMNFWVQELQYLQQIMGFKIPPVIRFTKMILSDEASAQKILIEMYDRNLITSETVLERMGEDPELELYRYKKEVNQRVKGNMDSKAGPYVDGLLDEKGEQKLKEIFAQTGVVTPSQVGVVLDDKTPGEKTAIQQQPKPVAAPGGGGKPKSKPKGKSGQGRPKNSKDSTKRKTKRPSIRTSANTVLWARKALDDIDLIVNPIYLEMVNKNNLRQLTDEEASDLNYVKFNVLSKLNPHTIVNLDIVQKCISENTKIDDELFKEYNDLVAECKMTNDKVTLEMLKSLQAFAYVVYITDETESDEVENGED